MSANGWSGRFGHWNRMLHYYAGLSILPFLWLFALSGLLLNHPEWNLHRFSSSSEERAIQTPTGEDRSALAQDLVRQLNLVGELEWPEARPDEGLEFRVAQPGSMTTVRVDLVGKKATLLKTQTNNWVVVQMLHTFPSLRESSPRANHDWVATKLWIIAIDGLAIALLVMVASSCYMWFQLKAKRRIGVVALALGFVSCGFFVWGLR